MPLHLSTQSAEKRAARCIVYGDSHQTGRAQSFREIGWSRDLPQDWTAHIGVGRHVAGNGHATASI